MAGRDEGDENKGLFFDIDNNSDDPDFLKRDDGGKGNKWAFA